MDFEIFLPSLQKNPKLHYSFIFKGFRFLQNSEQYGVHRL